MSREAIESFAEEIRDALPNIRRALAVAHACPDDRAALREAHRLTHSIKGTAALVGVYSLSDIALHQETLFEQVLEGRLSMNGGLRDTLERLNDVIEAFTRDLATGNVPEQRLSAEAQRLFARHIPPNGGRQPNGTDLVSSTALAAGLAFEIDGTTPVASAIPLKVSAEEIAKLPLADFRDEAFDHLREMAYKLDLFRRDLTRWDVLADVRRRVHSLKANGNMAGFHDVAQLAHHAEDLVQRLLDRTVPSTESAADCLQACVDAFEEQLESRLDESLLNQLHERLAFIIGGRTPIATLASDDSATSDAAPAELELVQSEPATTVNMPAVAATIEATAADIQSDKDGARGVSIDLDNRDNLSGEMLDVFTEEAEDHLRKIYAALSVLETLPAQMSQLQEVRRSAHTIKGAAGSVGLPLVAQLSHRMEDLLEGLFESQQIGRAHV